MSPVKPENCMKRVTGIINEKVSKNKISFQHDSFRESSFNMTRGDEDIEGELQNFLDTRKAGSEKIREGSENLYTSKPTGGAGGS